MGWVLDECPATRMILIDFEGFGSGIFMRRDLISVEPIPGRPLASKVTLPESFIWHESVDARHEVPEGVL